jgi:hypothetical protein
MATETPPMSDTPPSDPKTPDKLLYHVPGVVPGMPKPIHLVDLRWILGVVITNPAIRADMHADPAATLAKMNYVPNEKAVAFFNSLKSADFDKAVDALINTESSAAFNMGEY